MDAEVQTPAADVRPWRVFRMNDSDWWMARSLEDAVQFFCESQRCSKADCEEYGLLEDPRELTDAEIESLVFVDDSCSRDDPTRRRSFAAELRRRVRVERPEYPQPFASTEF